MSKVKPWHRWPHHLRPGGATRLAIYQRDNWTCQIGLPGCKGNTRKLELDHIIPPTDGGAWFDPINLRAACKPCNVRRRHLPTGATTKQGGIKQGGRVQPVEPTQLW